MSKVQSEAVLENNMIRSLVDLGYQQVTIKDEDACTAMIKRDT